MRNWEEREGQMLAFHNDPKIKEKYLQRVAAHRKADELIHGVGWARGKGCAIGCTLEAYEHVRYETELGIPQMLARLEDCIFEGLPKDQAQYWPERFLSAITVGSDLSLIGWQFLYWVVDKSLRDHGTDEVRKGCAEALKVLNIKSRGLEVSESAAESAESAARSAASAAWSATWSAAWSAARSAESAARSARSAAESARSAAESAWSAARSATRSAESAAESAAWSAARSAESAAESAAWSAARSARAAWSAARSAARSAAWSAESAARSAWSAWSEMADKLQELLKAA
jgi:hypothetical protein